MQRTIGDNTEHVLVLIVVLLQGIEYTATTRNRSYWILLDLVTCVTITVNFVSNTSPAVPSQDLIHFFLGLSYSAFNRRSASSLRRNFNDNSLELTLTTFTGSLNYFVG